MLVDLLLASVEGLNGIDLSESNLSTLPIIYHQEIFPKGSGILETLFITMKN